MGRPVNDGLKWGDNKRPIMAIIPRCLNRKTFAHDLAGSYYSFIIAHAKIMFKFK